MQDIIMNVKFSYNNLNDNHLTKIDLPTIDKDI